MRPAARLQSAIELLDEIIVAARENGASADALASRYFSRRRYAGSKDRRAIRDLTWRAIREFGECPETARSAFVTIADADEEIEALFDGSNYGPVEISENETRAQGALIPQWILPLLSNLVDAEERAALLERAPLDLRVNSLKSNRQEVLRELPEAVLLESSSMAIRLPTGFAVDRHEVLTLGKVDIQDLGSQLISEACHVQSGMTVLDLCAGAGGKTLALSAAMEAQGHLLASDSNRNRLGQLGPRADRAGANNIETRLLNPGKESVMLSDMAGACDVVLVDAPCSGSGTWRRNPETRWRLSPSRLQNVIEEQAKLLSIAAEMVTSGGHLIYAVCSLLESEGQGQLDNFLNSMTGWQAVDTGISAGRAAGAGILLTPHHDGCDGFFLARMQKL